MLGWSNSKHAGQKKKRQPWKPGEMENWAKKQQSGPWLPQKHNGCQLPDHVAATRHHRTDNERTRGVFGPLLGCHAKLFRSPIPTWSRQKTQSRPSLKARLVGRQILKHWDWSQTDVFPPSKQHQSMRCSQWTKNSGASWGFRLLWRYPNYTRLHSQMQKIWARSKIFFLVFFFFLFYRRACRLKPIVECTRV